MATLYYDKDANLSLIQSRKVAIVELFKQSQLISSSVGADS